jgi:hypothetical protein
MKTYDHLTAPVVTLTRTMAKKGIVYWFAWLVELEGQRIHMLILRLVHAVLNIMLEEQ